MPAPVVAGPAVQGGGTTGDVTLEAAGATDPRQADQWATAGAAALDVTAPPTAAPTAPPLAGALRPTAGLGELPQLSVPAAPALPAPGAVPTAAGDVAAALDANMGAALRAKVGGILGRAGTASSAHVGEITAARAAADTGRARIVADAAAQNTAAQAGDQEIVRLRTGWGAQRSGIVAEHRSGLDAESARTRDEATRTISEANAQAKAKADEEERA